MIVTGLNGMAYRLDPTPIGSGGEGDIYRILGMDSRVAKIYKADSFTQELEEKLRIMIEYPPNESVLSQVAWPLDMVYDDSGQCRGFVMPELHINAELGEIYKYPATLPISAQQKINIAQNICVVISEVHQAGYIFGDFNPRNIGLDRDTGLVSFLDTDTYHVVDPTGGKTYRCNVCAPGYAAPELLDKCSDYVATNPSASKNAYAQTPLATFTQETDNFALAIHIFKLLMNGYTPFGGIIETASVSQSSPGVGDAAVRRNSYCFRPGYKPQSVAIPSLEAFPEEIADLFTRAFIEGRIAPNKRPTAVEWYEALTRYEQELVTCPYNPLHQYDQKNDDCPLCEADRQYGEVVSGASSGSSIKQSTYAQQPKVVQGQSSQSHVTGYGQSTQTPLSASGPSPVQTPTPTSVQTQEVPYRKIAFWGIAVAVLITIIGFSMYNAHLNNIYSNAQRLFNNGQYVEAMREFSRISNHQDSAWMVLYSEAHWLFSRGDYTDARAIFSRISTYRTSEEMILRSDYQHAHALLSAGNFMEASELFSNIRHFMDSETMVAESYYQYARHLLFNVGDFAEAKEVLLQIHPHRESEELINESDYQHALHLISEGSPQEARRVLTTIQGFRDSSELIQEIDYDAAIALMNAGELVQSAQALRRLGSFRDSQAQLEDVRNRIYPFAVEHYRGGNLTAAERGFGETGGIERTADYLTLIRTRQGNITGDGRNLLDLIDFEDTREVINENDMLLRRFLGNDPVWGIGRRWSNSAGYHITFHTHDGDDWVRWNLPSTGGNHIWLSDGQRIMGNDFSSATPIWEYAIVSRNQIRVHSLVDGRNFTLNRGN